MSSLSRRRLLHLGLGVATLGAAGPLVAACARTTPPSGSGALGLEAVPSATFEQVGVDEVRAEIAEIAAATGALGSALLTDALSAASDAVVAPWSAAQTLAMLTDGTDGATQTQLRALLGTAGSADPSRALGAIVGENEQWAGDPGSVDANHPPLQAIMQFGTGVFLDVSLEARTEYLETLTRVYGTTLYRTDFDGQSVSEQLGEWVAVNTGSEIRSTSARVDGSTRILALSTGFLAAGWRYPFTEVRSGMFDGTENPVKVPLMSGTLPVKLVATNNFDAIELPCDGSLALQVVVPSRPGQVDGIRAHALTSAAMAALVEAEPETAVSVVIPRLRLASTGTNIADAAAFLGAADWTDPGAADFGPMLADATSVAVSVALQETVIRLAERGTIASPPGTFETDEVPTGTPAPGTGTPDTGTPGAPAPGNITPAIIPRFVADRPFAFHVVDTATGLTLFLAAVNQPTGE